MKQRARILLVGKHELACRLFGALRDAAGVELAVVPAMTENADEPARSSLKRLLSEAGFPALESDGPVPLLDAVEQFKPDLLISTGYDRIISAAVLSKIPRSINVHFGLLPRYRGNLSIPWAILNDDDVIGITVHDIAPSIDDGPIILQRHILNDDRLSCRELYDQSVSVGAELVEEFLAAFLQNTPARGVLQDERRATYYPPGFPSDFRVDWKQAGRYVYNFVRSAHFPPYRGAFTEMRGARVELLFPMKLRYEAPAARPGTLLSRYGSAWVATLNAIVAPFDVVVDDRKVQFQEFVSKSALIGERFS